MNKITSEERQKRKAKRKRVDRTYDIATFAASFFGVFSLIAIFTYVLIKGSGLISWNLITGDYYETAYHLTHTEDLEFCDCDNDITLEDDEFYSQKWGVAFQLTEDTSGHEIITISYLDTNSTLHQLYDEYDEATEVNVREGLEVNYINFGSGNIVTINDGLETMISELEASDTIRELYLSGEGGGIRGSLISTIYLIGLSLLFALPIGIFTAIYLTEYAKKNWITDQLRRLIEMLTGVPSIIFGMVGVVVFIRVTSIFGIDGRNLIAAAMTLAVIILPTIIRSTEESLKVIPTDLRQASLALGANKTQTTFKVVLPNALPGILTAVLLGIGRIIGESAALIFVLGTTISDNVSVTGSATTLAVQIWTVMGGEVANFELASAISIIILVVVLMLNLTVKYISYRLNKAWH